MGGIYFDQQNITNITIKYFNSPDLQDIFT